MAKDELMSMQHLAAKLAISYNIVRRYAEARGMAERMGGVHAQGKLGLRYPASSLNQWRRLAELHRAGAVTPQTAAAVLDALQDTTHGPDHVASDAANRFFPGGVHPTDSINRIAVALERMAVAQERLAAAHAQSDQRPNVINRIVKTIEIRIIDEL